MTNTYKQQLIDGAFGKHIIPKLDEISPYSTWAFTVAPAQDFETYFEFYNKSVDVLKHVFRGCFVDLRPELSTQNQRWHWHGYLTFGNAVSVVSSYLKLSKLKEFSTFTIKPIESWEWFVYVRKQRSVIKPYINECYNKRKLQFPYHLRLASINVGTE